MDIFRRSLYRLALIIIVLLGIPFLAAAEQSLTILFTHDLHDHLLPYEVLIDGKITTVGGYARLLEQINREKGRDPELLLLDGGDFSMGTLFQTIFSAEAPQLRIMGQMGYDVTTFGNHEFDFRARGLAESLAAAKNSGDALPRLTAGNVLFPTDGGGRLSPSLQQLQTAMDNYPVEEYVILERKGIKIGIFGLMGRDAVSNAPMAEVDFEDYLAAAERIVDVLQTRENVDLIICLSHAGTSGRSPKTEDELLAKKVPAIDVIISAHSHTELHQALRVGDTIIGSCGEYGMNLGIMRLVRGEDRWELAGYELRAIEAGLPENEELAAAIGEYQDLVEEKYLSRFGLGYDQVLARATFNFTPSFELGAEHKEEPLGSLISDAYIYAVQQAEGEQYEEIAAAIVPNGTIRGSFVQGDITTSQAFIVSSLGIGRDGIPGYPLVSVYLTGKELKTLCEVDASVAPIMGAAQLYTSGLVYTFNPRRLIFNRVTEVYLQKSDGSLEDIDDERLYRVVAGLYAGQMLPAVSAKSFGLLSLAPKNREGSVIRDFEEYIILDHSRGETSEIKEWQAIAQYLQSFPEEGGVPTIPLDYSRASGRKNVVPSLHPGALLKNPNRFAFAVYAVVAALGLGVGLAASRISAKRRARARKIFR